MTSCSSKEVCMQTCGCSSSRPRTRIPRQSRNPKTASPRNWSRRQHLLGATAATTECFVLFCFVLFRCKRTLRDLFSDILNWMCDDGSRRNDKLVRKLKRRADIIFWSFLLYDLLQIELASFFSPPCLPHNLSQWGINDFGADWVVWSDFVVGDF